MLQFWPAFGVEFFLSNEDVQDIYLQEITFETLMMQNRFENFIGSPIDLRNHS